MTANSITVLKDASSLRRQIADWRKAGEKIGLVPTMGALHEGHLSLVRAAKDAGATRVIVSIFVNPTQFAPNEDFNTYPKRVAEDLADLGKLGVHAAFTPDVDTMYPKGFNTTVLPEGPVVADLEAAVRPTHFAGVATVVCKLFNLVQPDLAVFGEKDYQQLMVIGQMVRDLNIPVQIIGAPIVRDEKGLALSSRNAYLSADELAVARQFNVVVRKVSERKITPDEGVKALLDAGVAAVDYLVIRDAETLGEPVESRPQRVVSVARVGRVRLLDNMAVTG
ncbi:MAG: pantoate--beta-alanine ligase [Rhodobiaceae bacterium]|nr:pantoate--beta-alanine ligase [Rhodobiaceae bacterium]